MVGRDVLPDAEGIVGFAQRREGFGVGHGGMAVIVFRIFPHHTLQQRLRLGGALLAEQALAEMGAGVEILPVPLQSGAITRLGLVEFALLKIYVPELRVMVRLVE